MKIKGIIICFLLFIGFCGLLVSSLDIGKDTGKYGYTNLWNATGEDLLVDNIVVAEDLEVAGTLNVIGDINITRELLIGANVTSGGFFKGLFNWTVLNDWLSFNGATLSFNETKLNETIDARIAIKSWMETLRPGDTELLALSINSPGITLTRINYESNKAEMGILEQYIFKFDDSSEQFISGHIDLPDSYDGGAITYELLISTFSGSETGKGTAWTVNSGLVEDGSDLTNLVWGTKLGASTLMNAANNATKVTINHVPGGGLSGAGLTLYFSLKRDAGNPADDLIADASLLSIKISQE